jgi:hypothetical protein
MSERDLIDRRVAAFDVLDQLEQLRIIPQRPRDRAQPADMLRVSPARIMPPTVGMRDIRDGQERTGRRRRNVMRNVEPSWAPLWLNGTLSSNTS